MCFLSLQIYIEKNIQYIVAPFEADAEMAYLSTSGRVDAVVTEDSDMLASDCKKVPFSWEKYSINPNTEKVILLCHYI